MSLSCEEVRQELASVQQELEAIQASTLRQNETFRLLERALLATNVSMTILDARQPGAPLVYANPSFERMSGYSLAEMLGRNPRFLRGEEQDQSAGDELDRAVSAGLGHTAVLRNYRKDGSLFWNELHLSPMRDENGVITHYVGIQHDVTERKEREAAQQQNDQYRRVVQDQTELICRYTPDFVLRFVNDAYLTHFGKGASELVGQNILALIAPEDMEQARSHVTGLTPDNPVSTSEHRSIMPDGSLRWFQWKDRAIFNDKGDITEFQGVGRDITAQKEIEESLRQSEEQWKLIFHTAPVGMAMTSMNDRYVQVNQAFCHLVGYNVEELKEMAFCQLVHPDDVNQYLELRKKLVDGEVENVIWEKRYIRKNGEILYTRVHGAITHDGEGRPLNFISQVVDMTEDKKAEEALKSKHNLLRTLIDNIPDYIFAKDLDGHFLISNRAHAAAGGILNPDDLVGKRAEDVFPSRMASQFSGDDLEVTQTGQPLFNIERTTVNRVGETRDVLTTKVPLVNPEQKLVGLVGISRDITDRKRSETALRLSEARNRAFLDAIPDLIFRLNRQGVFLDYRADPDGLYVQPERIIGSKIEDLLPAYLTALTYSNIEAALSSGQMQIYEYYLGATEQEILNYEARMVASGTDEVLIIVRDVTARKRAETELERSAKRLGTYHVIDQAILAAQSLEEIAHAALGYVRDLVPCERASVSTFDIEQSRVALIVSTSLETRANTGYSAPLSSKAMALLEQGTYMYARDLSTTQPRGTTQEILHQEGLRSQLSVPLKSNDKLIGALSLASTQADYFTDEHIEIIEEIAQQIAIAIWQAQLRDQIQRHTHELEQRVADRTLELTRAKERVEVILNGSGDGIILVHPATGMEQVNPAFNRMFACSAEDYAHQSLTALALMEDRPLLEQAIQNALRGQAINSLEFRAVRKDGSLFDAQIGIALVSEGDDANRSLVCNLSDITQRKAFEQQTRYHARLLGTISDAIISTDLNFNILSWNQAAEQIYGWSLEETMGKGAYEILMTDYSTIGPYEVLVKQLMEKGHWNGEVIQKKKDGQAIHILSSVTMLMDERGNSIGMVAVNRDITERRRAEETFRKTSELLQAILDTSSAVIYLTDTENRLLLANRRYAEIFNVNLDDFIGKSVLERFPSDQAQEFQTHDEQVIRQKKAIEVEENIPHSNGQVHTYISVKSPLLDADGNVYAICGISTDISSRKQAEEALRESEQRFRSYFELPLIGVAITSPEKQWVDANDRMCDLLGYSREELLKLSWEALTYPDDLDADVNAFNQLIAGEIENYNLDKRYIRKDGQVIYTNITVRCVRRMDGSINYFVALAQDITARKQAEEALRESEQRFRSYFELPLIGVAITSPEKTWVDANDRMCDLLGYSREELLKLSWEALTYPDDLDADVNAFNRLIAGEIENYNLDKRYIRKDGQVIYTNITVRCVRRMDGSINYFVALAQDITARKQMEHELREALAQQQELNELKTRFVSMASHEFRTPLATIMATTDSIGAYRKKMDDETIDKRLDKIRDQIHHLKSIIEDVLQFANLQSRQTEQQMAIQPVDLEPFCRQIIEDFNSRPASSNRIVFTCLDNPPMALVDPKLIRQSITNLIQNALKYSPEGKSVHIELSHDEKEIQLSIQDEGIGIPEADRKHLFEAFHRAANVGTISGTGLGLAITKQAVEMQGGRIGFETAEGTGTRFVITLPIKANNKVTYGKNTGY